MFETKRLTLRRWQDSDAENLFEYAKDPDVGPIAGWPAHQSIDESRDVIQNVFNGKEAYAFCLKTDNRAIGAIEYRLFRRYAVCPCMGSGMPGTLLLPVYQAGAVPSG